MSTDLDLPPLPVPRLAPPVGRLGRWLLHGGRLDTSSHHGPGHPWYRVLWLTGVDYFSTLGYQPGIALVAAGAMSPIATLLLIALTLFGALPVYAQVARRSFAGQGSIAMLENLLPGWNGKVFVLVLIGFATTDFVITMTLSAADAAQHLVENPFLHPILGDHQLPITLAALAALALVFLKGFREAIGIAMFITVPYLLLNTILIGRGVYEIAVHPEFLSRWQNALMVRGDWTLWLAVSAIVFPKLALGMSGFETGVTVMPLVAGDPEHDAPSAAVPAPSPASGLDPARVPYGRIRATRKLLAAAAVIMSVMLAGSSFVTTLLLRPIDVQQGGPAYGRALAHVAHTYLGSAFGTVYDFSTIIILGFAGASAMAGLLNLIPRYLPRFGMAPRWVAFARPLVLVLFVIDVLVTLAFRADVEAQGGAYATGVLVLMLSAAAAVALALWREAFGTPAVARLRTRGLSLYFWLVTLVFVYTLVDNVVERPDGVIVASVFILGVIVLGGASRWLRATELRAERISFADSASKAHWPRIVHKKVHLVAVKALDAATCSAKRAEIQRFYRMDGPFAFVHVELLDNRSEFLAPLQLHVQPADGEYKILITGAVAVANSLAYLSELIDPIAIYLGLTRRNPMTQSLRYVLFGEGEVGFSVYQTLVRYWDWTPEDDVRPVIFMMSE